MVANKEFVFKLKTKIYLKIMPWPKIQYKYLYYC